MVCSFIPQIYGFEVPSFIEKMFFVKTRKVKVLLVEMEILGRLLSLVHLSARCPHGHAHKRIDFCMFLVSMSACILRASSGSRDDTALVLSRVFLSQSVNRASKPCVIPPQRNELFHSPKKSLQRLMPPQLFSRTRLYESL